MRMIIRGPRNVYRSPLLQELSREGRTVAVATHDSSIAARADVILEMSDGRVVGPAAAPDNASSVVSSKVRRVSCDFD